MPASLRPGRPRHPAYDHRCPHCSAPEKARCTTISGRHTKTAPCPARLAAWATATACCTTCQVPQTYPCHDNGRRRDDVHPARYTEAEETAA
ncbi:hypothetical protein [Streptomyces sp. ISL-66]|uniref:hypothetical protein n=1 Tax=Streptomyces sp. ISL-66 TaxID=2819186 RepID=UPI0020353ECE|nr:hypothetical protein [Streptomyces sp. ISL-66]